MHPVNPSEKQGCGGGHSQRLDTELQAATKNGDFPNQRGGGDWGISRSLEANKGKRAIISPAGKQNLDHPKHFRKREIS